MQPIRILSSESPSRPSASVAARAAGRTGRDKPSRESIRTRRALGPRGDVVHDPPRGPRATPASAAQLKRGRAGEEPTVTASSHVIIRLGEVMWTVGAARLGGTGPLRAHSSGWTGSSRPMGCSSGTLRAQWCQGGQPREVAGTHRQRRQLVDLAHHHHLADRAEAPAPAETLLEARARALADVAAEVSRGTSVEGAAAAAIDVPRDRPRDLDLAHALTKPMVSGALSVPEVTHLAQPASSTSICATATCSAVPSEALARTFNTRASGCRSAPRRPFNRRSRQWHLPPRDRARGTADRRRKRLPCWSRSCEEPALLCRQ